VGICGVAVILPFATFVVREPRAGEASPLADESVGEGGSPSRAKGSGEGLADVLRRPAFWGLFYLLFCYAFAQLGLADHIILYLGDSGFSRSEAAGALEIALGAGILAKLGAGVVALRVSARAALGVNTLLLLASIGLLPFADRDGVLALIGVLFGVSTAARDVLFPLLVADVFGVHQFARVFGALMVAFFPGGVGGPLLLASAHDWLGGYEAGFVGMFALLVGAIVMLGFLRSDTRR
jgi:predicted MFS family arabinose efflux permease